MSKEQKEDFNEFIVWFFDTLESVNFGGGAHLPCDQWWEHPEALHRFIAIWSSWLGVDLPQKKADGSVLGPKADKNSDDNQEERLSTTLSVWWKECVDYHKQVLFYGRTSPFSKCSGGKHNPEEGIHTAPTKVWNYQAIPEIPEGALTY